MIFRLLKQIYHQLKPPYIAIELASTRRSTIIPIHNLRESGFFYHLTGSDNISDVTLFGIFAPRIRFDSADIRVKSLLSEHTDPLGTFARVGWIQALKIRNILGNRFSANLIIIENDIKTYVKLCELNCECRINVASVE